MTAALHTSAERKAYLDELADAALAERKTEAEAARQRVEAEKAESKRLAAIQAEAAEKAQAYFAAVENAEAAATDLYAALHKVHVAADEINSRLGSLKTKFLGWQAPSVARRMSRLVSAKLKNLPAVMSGKYGELPLARLIELPKHRGESWAARERRETITIEPKENSNDR